MASGLMTLLLAALARVGSCWISEGEFPPHLTVPAMFDYFTYEAPLFVYVLFAMEIGSRSATDLILRDLQNNPDMWLQVDQETTKLLKLQLMRMKVKYEDKCEAVKPISKSRILCIVILGRV
ncbi:hypothetical protein VPH35_015955 [Triticum aestivum]|uniref:Uncharacterized protein n=1 Tax=Aegilops tauschii TaxID=37682 RepID=M8BRG7_AEGTA